MGFRLCPQRCASRTCRHTLIEAAIVRQREFIKRVPDPDRRAIAEANLMTLGRDAGCRSTGDRSTLGVKRAGRQVAGGVLHDGVERGEAGFILPEFVVPKFIVKGILGRVRPVAVEPCLRRRCYNSEPSRGVPMIKILLASAALVVGSAGVRQRRSGPHGAARLQDQEGARQRPLQRHILRHRCAALRFALRRSIGRQFQP